MSRTICVMARVADQDDGLGIYTKNLVRHLTILDHKTHYVVVLVSEKNYDFFSSLPNTDVIVKRVSRKLIWDQFHVARIARRCNADIIFNPKFSIPVATSIPCVFVLQGSDWYVNPANYPWWDNLYIRAAMPLYSWRAKRLLAISQHTVDELKRRFRLDQSKCRVTYAGVSSNFNCNASQMELDEFSEKFKLPDRFILTVARAYHTGHQGLPTYAGGNIIRLLHAYRSYRHQGGKLPLVVAGANIKDYLLSSGFGESDLEGLLFLGMVPHKELHCAYHLAECSVLATLCESFGFPIVEALATGCPAIIPNTCAAPEIAGDAARLVDPYDINSIAAAMYELTENIEMRNRLRTRGLERAKKFSWKKTAARTLRVFDEIKTP